MYSGLRVWRLLRPPTSGAFSKVATLSYEIINGDCRALPLIVEPGTVQTCITSPPYFGLRDYGVDGQIGLEQTPDAYVAQLVDVFRGVRELLADDGTLWLNLGDSYAGSWGAQGHRVTNEGVSKVQIANHPKRASNTGTVRAAGVKPKDLYGIPWRVAFALQADGWYLRQDIIWHKPNPMPESVTDRCTKAHEYIFLLSKSPKYYFDSVAMKEPVAASTVKRLQQPTLAQQVGSTRVPGKTNGNMKAVGNGETRNRRSVWTVATRPYKGAHFATFPIDLIEPCVLAGSRPGDLVLDPFGGAGTTALAALKHGRRALLCELNPEYVALAENRIAGSLA